MPNNYIITEPMPTTTTYVRSGRGGAGNTFRISSTSKKPIATSQPVTSTGEPVYSSSPPPSGSSSSSSTEQQPRRYFSGIGGAGNVHKTTERPTLSLDERFRRAVVRDSNASVGRCGIGGAGNVFRKPKVEIEPSDAGSVNSRTKLWTRVSGSLSRD